MKPAFSKEAESAFKELLSHYPKTEAALLPVLFLAQDQFGWISREVQGYVAERLGLSLARVESVLSFYTMFRTHPVGRFHIEICRNLSCDLCGAPDLMNAIKEELGVQPGETTSDGLFTFSTVECLAACGGGPVLTVNGQYHENMDAKKLKDLVAELRAQSD